MSLDATTAGSLIEFRTAVNLAWALTTVFSAVIRAFNSRKSRNVAVKTNSPISSHPRDKLSCRGRLLPSLCLALTSLPPCRPVMVTFPLVRCSFTTSSCRAAMSSGINLFTFSPMSSSEEKPNREQAALFTRTICMSFVATTAASSIEYSTASNLARVLRADFSARISACVSRRSRKVAVNTTSPVLSTPLDRDSSTGMISPPLCRAWTSCPSRLPITVVLPVLRWAAIIPSCRIAIASGISLFTRSPSNSTSEYPKSNVAA
mmetsp:Transcript_12686/g.17336  ORF Transcript_12686/g.17336 Transcript_12686/m.17336 type:complete len:262 (+) Transcript_12686:1172-1957(+)